MHLVTCSSSKITRLYPFLLTQLCRNKRMDFLTLFSRPNICTLLELCFQHFPKLGGRRSYFGVLELIGVSLQLVRGLKVMGSQASNCVKLKLTLKKCPLQLLIGQIVGMDFLYTGCEMAILTQFGVSSAFVVGIKGSIANLTTCCKQLVVQSGAHFQNSTNRSFGNYFDGWNFF